MRGTEKYTIIREKGTGDKRSAKKTDSEGLLQEINSSRKIRRTEVTDLPAAPHYAAANRRKKTNIFLSNKSVFLGRAQESWLCSASHRSRVTLYPSPHALPALTMMESSQYLIFTLSPPNSVLILTKKTCPLSSSEEISLILQVSPNYEFFLWPQLHTSKHFLILHDA